MLILHICNQFGKRQTMTQNAGSTVTHVPGNSVQCRMKNKKSAPVSFQDFRSYARSLQNVISCVIDSRTYKVRLLVCIVSLEMGKIFFTSRYTRTRAYISFLSVKLNLQRQKTGEE